MVNQHSNSYRQPKPKGRDCIAGGKFYLANDVGSYSLNATAIELAVCSEYVWVSETLSIPLTAITDLGRSKHGGYIDYWDALAGEELRFNFTKLGFLRFDRKGMDAFLEALTASLPTKAQAHEEEADLKSGLPEEICCERCGSNDVDVYVFEVFRFIGFAPIAYSYSLTPLRYLLCAVHAREQAIRCSVKTALFGYLGFPAFLAAPWYIFKNLLSLRRVGVVDGRTTAICILWCIILPCTLIAAPMIWFAYS